MLFCTFISMYKEYCRNKHSFIYIHKIIRNRKFIKYSSLNNSYLWNTCVFPVSLVQPLRTIIDLHLFNGSLQYLYVRSVKYQDTCEGGMLGDVERRSSFWCNTPSWRVLSFYNCVAVLPGFKAKPKPCPL
jgi:hypothetical protein